MPLSNPVFTPLDPRQFGVDPTGAVNSTAGLLAFFNACIAGQSGNIPAGTYLVTPGALAFTTNYTNMPFPFITTAGYSEVTFLADPASGVDAPLLQFTNGTATTTTWVGWSGGYLGGITFTDNRTLKTQTDGLYLAGFNGTRFGYMAGNNVRAVVAQSGATFSASASAYAIKHCEFDAIESVGGASAFTALYTHTTDGAGFAANTVNTVKTTGGQYALIGTGRHNIYNHIVATGATVAAITDVGALVGMAPGFNMFVDISIDACANGIRQLQSSNNVFQNVRIVSRYQATPTLYWPLQCVNIASANVEFTNLTVQVEAGGTKGQVGTFIFTGTPANCIDVIADISVIDNAGFVFADIELYSGFTSAAKVKLTRSGAIIWNSLKRVLMRASVGVSYSPGSTVSNFINATGRMHANIVEFDMGGNYNNSTYVFTAPYSGKFRVYATTIWTLNPDTSVYVAITRQRSATFTVEGLAALRLSDDGGGSVSITGQIAQTMDLQAGDLVSINLVGAGPLVGQNFTTPNVSVDKCNYFEIQEA